MRAWMSISICALLSLRLSARIPSLWVTRAIAPRVSTRNRCRASLIWCARSTVPELVVGERAVAVHVQGLEGGVQLHLNAPLPAQHRQLAPQYRLLTPGEQWQSRGETPILAGVGVCTPLCLSASASSSFICSPSLCMLASALMDWCWSARYAALAPAIAMPPPRLDSAVEAWVATGIQGQTSSIEGVRGGPAEFGGWPLSRRCNPAAQQRAGCRGGRRTVLLRL